MTRRRTWLAYVGIVVVSAVGGYLGGARSGAETREANYEKSVDDRVNFIAGCERNKADRRDVARGIAALGSAVNAQAGYLSLVLEAASVKQDVKDAAQVNYNAQKNAYRVVKMTARSLRSRTGENLVCATAFPAPEKP